MLVYCATNTKNGRKYIGKTIHGIKKRKGEHESSSKKSSGNYFHKAIGKHGAENFTWEILCTANDIGALNILEEYFIAKYGTMDREKGYNLRAGGEGGIPNNDTRKRISEGLRGKKNKPLTEQARKNMSDAQKGLQAGENHPMWGKTHSEKSRAEMSAAKKGEKNHNFDPRIYVFCHPEHGITKCTRHDLQIKYKLHRGRLSDLVNRKCASHKGWCMAAASNFINN